MRGAAESPEQQVIELVQSGEGLLAEERQAIFSGLYTHLPKIAVRKQALLSELDAAIPIARGTPLVRNALDKLIRDSRRNERLLRAARAGLASARRRLEAIDATRRGDVAYDADGSRIVSRDDATGKSSRA